MTMSAHDQQLLASSENPLWRTPQPEWQALYQEFPISIDLAASQDDALVDRWLGPGSPVVRIVEGHYIDPQQVYATDALAFEHWAEYITEGTYGFFNPPYSRKREREAKKAGAPYEVWRAFIIDEWIKRAALTAASGRGVLGVLPASIQTQWWQQYIWQGVRYHVTGLNYHRAREVRFSPHRWAFDPPPGVKDSRNANVNTAVVIWDPYNPHLIEPWQPQVRYWSVR